MLHGSPVNGKGNTLPASAKLGPDASATVAEGEYPLISLRDLIPVLRRRIWIIGAVATVLVGAILAYSLVQTPTYEASIRMLVGQERGTTERPDDVGDLEELTGTMAEGVKSPPIAEEVIRRLGLQMTPEELLERQDVRQISETQFIQVDYRDSSPERARQVVDTIGEVFSERISEVSPSASAITATVWTPAVTPGEPVSPKPARNSFLALVLGLILGMGLALLLEYLHDSPRSPEEAEKVSGVPTFGIIPEFRSVRQKGGTR